MTNRAEKREEKWMKRRCKVKYYGRKMSYKREGNR